MSKIKNGINQQVEAEMQFQQMRNPDTGELVDAGTLAEHMKEREQVKSDPVLKTAQDSGKE